jgi:hypothetical protein
LLRSAASRRCLAVSRSPWSTRTRGIGR